MYELPGFHRPVEVSAIILAACLLVGGPLLGWLVQRVALGRLKARLSTAQWGTGDVIARAVHNVVIAMAVLVSIYVAIGTLPLESRLSDGLQRLVVAALVISVSVAVMRGTTDTIKLYSLRTQRVSQSSSIFVNLARVFIAAVALLFVLQAFDVSITPLLAAMGVGGLAVALAAQDTLSNFFAGIQIIATKKVKVGDFVKLDNGEEGYVSDIDWRHTSVRQLPNNMVLVPNAQLMNSVIVNYHYPEREMSVLVQVGVSYQSDLAHVERVTIEAAREVLGKVEGGVADFDPFIRYHTFNDSSIDFSVILRVREYVDKYLIKHEFVKGLHDRYRAEGIVIPFPIRTIDWPQDGGPQGSDQNAVRSRRGQNRPVS